MVIIFMLYGRYRPFRIGTGSVLGLDWLDFSRKHGNAGLTVGIFSCAWELIGSKTIKYVFL